MGKKDYNRCDRVASLVKRELAVLIPKEIHGPDLSLLTVSDVKVTRDLSVAQVYVVNLSDKNIDEIMEALTEAAGYLRHLLGKRIRMRVIPELRFAYDHSFAEGAKIDRLLDQL
ncbi:MAG: 30S ribosome-binding factor RbfA [bacterium]